MSEPSIVGRRPLTTALAGMETDQWLVGEEHDEAAFARLGAALRAMGGTMLDSGWRVGGSQELSEWRVRFPSGLLNVTAETYRGLRVVGPRDLVLQAKELYRGTTAC